MVVIGYSKMVIQCCSVKSDCISELTPGPVQPHGLGALGCALVQGAVQLHGLCTLLVGQTSSAQGIVKVVYVLV